MKAAVMGVVQAHFRPEFINRLDDIVVFHPLDKQQIKQIARIQMRGLEKRLAERGLKLAVSDAAFDLLGNVGFDPVYGARPLKRAIQRSWKTRWRSRSCPAPSSTAIPSKSATTAVAWCSPRRESRGAPPDRSAPFSGSAGPCPATSEAVRNRSPSRTGWASHDRAVGGIAEQARAFGRDVPAPCCGPRGGSTSGRHRR
jgi:hypothetical protein